MRWLAVSLVVAGCAFVAPAGAAECPGNPLALGVSRTIVVDPREHPRIGTMQYEETLPLKDKELVLTFDDGPIPPYTSRILDILASECVKATYFLVGQMARAYPQWVRRIQDAGHTIGTHTQNHPNRGLRDISFDRGLREINEGISSAANALGGADALAPFFRYSGFGSTPESEVYLAGRGIQVWGADFPADDWKRIGDKEIVRRAMQRLAAKGKGILLLHDIHPATVLALPQLFRELKAGGYHIVHVVPAGSGQPKTETVASEWLLHPPVAEAWPPVARALPGQQQKKPFGPIEAFGPDYKLAAPVAKTTRVQVAVAGDDLPETSIWPMAAASPENADPVLPQPDPADLGIAINIDDAISAREAIGLRPTIKIRQHVSKARVRLAARVATGNQWTAANREPKQRRSRLAVARARTAPMR